MPDGKETNISNKMPTKGLNKTKSKCQMENNSKPYKTSAVENKIIKNKLAENLLKIKNKIKTNKNIYYLHSEC